MYAFVRAFVYACMYYYYYLCKFDYLDDIKLTNVSMKRCVNDFNM